MQAEFCHHWDNYSFAGGVFARVLGRDGDRNVISQRG